MKLLVIYDHKETSARSHVAAGNRQVNHEGKEVEGHCTVTLVVVCIGR